MFETTSTPHKETNTCTFAHAHTHKDVRARAHTHAHTLSHRHTRAHVCRAGMTPGWVCHLSPLIKLLGRNRVVGCSTRNTGLFQQLAASGVVRATFCGHDHMNDFVVRRDGVYMCYGRCSSFSPPSDWEGDAAPLPFARGTRQRTPNRRFEACLRQLKERACMLRHVHTRFVLHLFGF
jgi:hypothetical protein